MQGMSMSRPELENLVRIGQLKAEPRNTLEATRMLDMARTRLADAKLSKLSLEGRFTSAYNATHAAALAALRWHGYRSENRYTVFQCLTHTLGWPPAAGGFLTQPTKSATWRSTKATSTSRNPRWPRCASWWRSLSATCKH